MRYFSIYRFLLLIPTIQCFVLISSAYCQNNVQIQIDLKEGVTIQDEFSLSIWQHFVFVGSQFESNHHNFLPTYSNPKKIEDVNPGYHMRMLLVNKKLGVVIPFVPIESGDDVTLKLTMKNGESIEMEFLGQGHEKYSFLHQFKIYQANGSSLWQKLKQYQKPTELVSDISKIRVESLDLLDKFKNNMTDSVYFILKADVLGYFNNLQLLMTATGYVNSEGKRKKEYEAILEYQLESNPFIFSDDILSLSKDYIEYLYTRAKIKLIYRYKPAFTLNDLYLKVPYSFMRMYQELRDHNDGKVRDQLLSYLLVNSSEMVRYFGGVDPSEFQNCLDDALFTINTPSLIRLITHELNSSTVNVKAFNFELPDDDGNIIRLSDFKGKVVLMDFWANGCSGCLSFKRKFEEFVYPTLKDNLDFVFVSINVDKRKETWLKALPVYSRKEFVNLSLYEQGSNHQVYKHYNIKGLPTLLLVNHQGILVSSTLPRDMTALQFLINKELKELKMEENQNGVMK